MKFEGVIIMTRPRGVGKFSNFDTNLLNKTYEILQKDLNINRKMLIPRNHSGIDVINTTLNIDKRLMYCKTYKSARNTGKTEICVNFKKIFGIFFGVVVFIVLPIFILALFKHLIKSLYFV